MTQGHIDALQIILKSDTIRSALTELFDETLQESLPQVANEPNETIGEKYRAYVTSKSIIGQAFYKLDSLAIPEGERKEVRHI